MPILQRGINIPRVRGQTQQTVKSSIAPNTVSSDTGNDLMVKVMVHHPPDGPSTKLLGKIRSSEGGIF